MVAQLSVAEGHGKIPHNDHDRSKWGTDMRHSFRQFFRPISVQHRSERASEKFGLLL